MRESIAERGPVGSTFDHVAREAGVSRGLLHYYFGSKERLIIEVIKRDMELRLEQLEAALGPVESVDELVQIMLSSLREILEQEPSTFTIGFEMLGEARRNPEIGAEFTVVQRRLHERTAQILERKQTEGVIKMKESPQAVATFILDTANGMAFQVVADAEADHSETIAIAGRAATYLLGG